MDRIKIEMDYPVEGLRLTDDDRRFMAQQEQYFNLMRTGNFYGDLKMNPDPRGDEHMNAPPLPYSQMVENLFKKLPTFSESLMHAFVGIAGESGELLDAVKKQWIYNRPLDRVNVLEELGDLTFYHDAAYMLLMHGNEIPLINLLEQTVKEAHRIKSTRPSWPGGEAAVSVFMACELFMSASTLLQLTNHAFLQRVPAFEYTPAQLVGYAMPLAELTARLAYLIEFFGFTYEQVVAANREKLTGKKPRYPGGVYTDAAAQARADKASPEFPTLAQALGNPSDMLIGTTSDRNTAFNDESNLNLCAGSAIDKEIRMAAAPVDISDKKLPTIEELEKILRDPDARPLHVATPPPMSREEALRELSDFDRQLVTDAEIAEMANRNKPFVGQDAPGNDSEVIITPPKPTRDEAES